MTEHKGFCDLLLKSTISQARKDGQKSVPKCIVFHPDILTHIDTLKTGLAKCQ